MVLVMYACERWAIKKAEHRRIDAFKLWCWRKLESPLDCKEIKLVNPKGNQPWIFTGRTDAEVEVPVLWTSDLNSQLIGKDSDAGKDWRQEEKDWQRMKWLGGIIDSVDMSLSKARNSKGQGILACCSPRAHKESDTTEGLNNNSLGHLQPFIYGHSQYLPTSTLTDW